MKANVLGQGLLQGAWWLLKLALLAGSMYVVLNHTTLQDAERSIEAIQANALQSWWLLLCFVALMPVNWWFETKKWAAVNGSLGLPRQYHLKGVLAGQALSLSSPQLLGDWLGRMLHAPKAHRRQTAAAMIVANTAQLLATLIPGWFAAWVVMQRHFGSILAWQIAIPCFMLLLGLLMAYFRVSWAIQSVKLFLPVSQRDWLRQYLPQLDKRILADTLLYAGLRYATFFTQFLLMLAIMQVELPIFQQGVGIAWIFLAKTILPTLNVLGDLGVREGAAVLYFNQWPDLTEGVVLASLAVWVLNVLIPALAGWLVVLWAKLPARD